MSGDLRPPLSMDSELSRRKEQEKFLHLHLDPVHLNDFSFNLHHHCLLLFVFDIFTSILLHNIDSDNGTILYFILELSDTISHLHRIQQHHDMGAALLGCHIVHAGVAKEVWKSLHYGVQKELKVLLLLLVKKERSHAVGDACVSPNNRGG